MFMNEGLWSRLAHSSRTKEQKRDGWFVFHAKQRVPRAQWDFVLSEELALNQMQIYSLMEFIKRYDLIIGIDEGDLNIAVPFALSKQDDFVFIQVPYKNNDNRRYVQHTIKTLE